MSPLRTAALALALTACVDVPRRSEPPQPEAGPLDSAAPDAAPPPVDAAPLDARPPIDAAPPPPDLGAPDADGVVCPDPCTPPGVVAAYLPLDRARAAAVLDDGTLLIGGGVADPEAFFDAIRARAPQRIGEIRLPEGVPMAGDRSTEVLLHVSGDLATLVGAYRLDGSTGDVVDIQVAPPGGPFAVHVVTAHGIGRVEGGAALPDRGYLTWAVSALPADGQTVDAVARLVPAAGRYQQVPPFAVGPGGSLTVSGAPGDAVGSQAVWFDPGNVARVMPGLRHHVDVAGSPAFGPALPTHRYSTLPLTVGNRCALRTSAEEPGAADVFWRAAPDGNGGMRFGRRPLDAFASAPCPTPGGVAEAGPAVGPHGWSAADGVAVAVGGAAFGDDGAAYLAFDAETRRNGRPDRAPAVVAYDADGHLRWFQRLHPDAVVAADGAVMPVASTQAQHIRGLVFDHGDPAVVVAVQSRTDDTYPLWTDTVDGPPGFQGLPGATGSNPVGWVGRLAPEDGRLLSATWLYRTDAQPALGRMRAGRLRCFVDERQTDTGPQAAFIDPGRLAVAPDGRVAVAGRGFGLSNTPDAWQATGAPFESPSAPFVRIYDRALAELEYATAVGPLPASGPDRFGEDVQIEALRFTDDGALLVLGTQSVRDADRDDIEDGASLPTAAVPGWAEAEWTAEQRSGERQRAFLLRLVSDPSCGR